MKSSSKFNLPLSGIQRLMLHQDITKPFGNVMKHILQIILVTTNIYLQSAASLGCSGDCKHGSCDTANGLCRCEEGYYGEMCDFTCSSHCIRGTCDPITGHCNCHSLYYGKKCNLLVCDAGYYGDFCEHECSEYCQGRRCDPYSGSCLCKTGYYGRNCTKECPQNCSDKVCDQRSGECSACELGYYGKYCTMSCPDECYESCDPKSGSCSNPAIMAVKDRLLLQEKKGGLTPTAKATVVMVCLVTLVGVSYLVYWKILKKQSFRCMATQRYASRQASEIFTSDEDNTKGRYEVTRVV